jgi:VanZ family protein
MTAVTEINKKTLRFICWSILILIALFGLWPFNLNPVNQVFWLKDEPGVRFTGPGHLYGTGSLSDFFSNRPVSLECWLRPAAEPNNRLPHILSFRDGRRQEVFLLGQWKDALAIRVRTSRADIPRGYRERGKGQVLVKNRVVFITLTSSPEESTLYVDGARVQEFPGFPLLESRPAGPSVLVLGNSPTGKGYWEGDLLGLALYSRTLSDQEVRQNHLHWMQRDYQSLKSGPGLIGLYPFNEGKGERIGNLASDSCPLLKPAVFHPRQKVILEWPTKEQLKRRGFYQDLAVNILGFIPLGYFLALWLLRFSRLSAPGAGAATLLLGALLSLGIELTQVYLPTRDSSAGDLIFNILGTLTGIMLLQGLHGRPSHRTRTDDGGSVRRSLAF